MTPVDHVDSAPARGASASGLVLAVLLLCGCATRGAPDPTGSKFWFTSYVASGSIETSGLYDSRTRRFSPLTCDTAKEQRRQAFSMPLSQPQLDEIERQVQATDLWSATVDSPEECPGTLDGDPWTGEEYEFGDGTRQIKLTLSRCSLIDPKHQAVLDFVRHAVQVESDKHTVEVRIPCI